MQETKFSIYTNVTVIKILCSFKVFLDRTTCKSCLNGSRIDTMLRKFGKYVILFKHIPEGRRRAEALKKKKSAPGSSFVQPSILIHLPIYLYWLEPRAPGMLGRHAPLSYIPTRQPFHSMECLQQ